MRLNLDLRRNQWDVTALTVGVLLAFSVLFGGASRDNALRVALVELAALPVLVLACTRLIKIEGWRDHTYFLAIIGAVLAIPIAQLIPLPAPVWTSLPGRQELVLALEIAGVSPGWSQISLTPDKTWASWLAVLPAIGCCIALLAIKKETRRLFVWSYLALAVSSMALGVLQLVSGTNQFHPWATTAPGYITGFFANRNHLATFLLMIVPVVAALSAPTPRRSARQNKSALWLGGLVIAFAIVMLAVVRSRAGVILIGPTLLGTGALFWLANNRTKSPPALVGMTFAVIAALGIVFAVGLSPVLERFESVAPEGRFQNWPYVIQAAQDYLPVGAGMGSFDPVYRSVEPLELLDWNYFNQAHNDYLEIWLEAGWLGYAALIGFLIWYARRTIAAWRAPTSMDTNLQRAASISILVVLLHSTMDYPLRTITITVAFAFMASILEFSGRPSPRRHDSMLIED